MKGKILSAVSAVVAAVVITIAGPGLAEEVQAASYSSAIQACALTDKTNVGVVANVAAGTASDDGMLYLFEIPTYGTALTGNPVASTQMNTTANFGFPVNFDKADSRLYSKFAVAVKTGGQFVQITEAKYISNPEVLAEHTIEYPVQASKKGLQMSPVLIGSGQIEDLGIQQTTHQISINKLFGPTTNGAYPTINYTYNGKNYQLNGAYVSELDSIVKVYTAHGVVVTGLLLNELDAACLQTTHPLARTKTESPYYMMNAAEATGVDYLSAAGSFLAKRYSDIGVGRIHNWVIGNEVNARSDWNYMQDVGVEGFTAEYAKVMRVFYTAIKSTNANARVYMSVDHTWDRNYNDGRGYDGKDMVDAMARNSATYGNFDWGVDFHPYPVALTWPKFWSYPEPYRSMRLTNGTENTPMLTPDNMYVLTDYMMKAQNLDRAGQVRSLIITEIGFGSSQGQAAQAAALAYAYYNAAYNQHIDAFIAVRDIDVAYEVAQGLPFGIKNPDGTPKEAYSVYKNVDQNPSAVAGYAAIVGASNWQQVIHAR